MNLDRQQDAEQYLSERTGRLEYRFLRYGAVADALEARGLDDSSLLADFGAGMCDFDFYLRSVRGWKGRYVPIDASIDGVDLGDPTWFPRIRPDFSTAIEVVEHLPDWQRFVWKLRHVTREAVVLTTPNTDVLGAEYVREMDRTHVSPVWRNQLHAAGFATHVESFFGQPGDSLLAVSA